MATRLRSKNFGSPDEWLSGVGEEIGGYKENRLKSTNTRADVVFAFFGYNESYGGDAGLPTFRKQLDDWITHTLAQKYNGKTAPRIVLFSPIAHEDLRNPDLPDGKANNARLEMYTLAMSQVAAARGVRFVDLFAPTRSLYATVKTPLTADGVHLNEEGNRRLAEIIDRDLFGAPPRTYARNYLSALQRAVADKSFQWFKRYRTTDAFATFGDRAFLTFIKGNPRNVNPASVKSKEDVLPTNYEVLEREVEVLDHMTGNRDRQIWRIARGLGPNPAEVKVGDSDTPPFIDAGTNEPGKGPNGAHIYLDGTEAITKMKLGPGIKVELFASEKEFPELVNPVQLAVDTRGRLWVAAWKNYPHWQPKTPMDDKLIILEDTNGDGKADKRTVFAGDLDNPTGFEFWNGGVIVSQAPNLVFIKDTNGDDKYDTKQILIGGMDSADTHHTMNSFTFDPGGALYIREGIFHRSQVETPWGPVVRQADGGVFRFEPRTYKFETYIPMNFPNPHGHTFDYWGRDIIFDATGGQPYYGPSMSTKKYYPAMESTKAPRPGQVRTRPVGGSEIISSRHFPDEMQGNLVVLNTIGFRGLLNYKITEDGAGLKMTEVDPIIESADENFRPVDAEIGADGALYIADWQNPIIGHMQHNLRDTSRDHGHGRIYRITYNGRPALKPTPIAGEPIDRLLDLLKEPEDRVRYRAKIELSGRNSNDVTVGADHLDIASRQGQSAVRAPDDGSALGAAVEQPRRSGAVEADAALERSVGARCGNARAVLLARPHPRRDGTARRAGQGCPSGRAARGRTCRQLLPDARRRPHRQGGREGSAGQVPGLRLSAVADHARRTGEEEHDDGECAGGGEHDDHRAAGFVSGLDAPRPARQGSAEHRHRHSPRADDVRRPLVRRRGREARAADAHELRLHAAQHHRRRPRFDHSDRYGGRDHAGAERA